MAGYLNPMPDLIAQQTGSWCFAACEAMVRLWRNGEQADQFTIARNCLYRLAEQPDAYPDVYRRLAEAREADLLLGIQPDDPASDEVALIRNQFGTLDFTGLGAQQLMTVNAASIQAQIDQNHMVVLGNNFHFFVVFGYNDNENNQIEVLDPRPVNTGQVRQIDINTLSEQQWQAWSFARKQQ